MMDRNEELRKRILETFRIEAEENLESMSSYLLELEKDTTENRKNELSEFLYRSAHSLKGAARAVEIDEVESLCHALEDVMSAVRNNDIEFNTSVFDVMFDTVDLIEVFLNTENAEDNQEIDNKIAAQIENLSMIEMGSKPNTSKPVKDKPSSSFNKQNTTEEEEKQAQLVKTTEPAQQNESEVKKHNKTANEESKSTEQTARTDKPTEPKNEDETIRVTISKLNDVLLQSEELLSIKLLAANRTDKIRETLNRITEWNKKSLEAITNMQYLNKSINGNCNLQSGKKSIDEINSFCQWSKIQMNTVESEMSKLLLSSENEAYSANLKIDNLIEDTKQLVMVPFSYLLNIFPKMVRNISKDLGKNIGFQVEGENIEIDRRILEQIRPTLIHIIRNSIDYGIETPEIRKKKNKPDKGLVKIAIEQLQNNKVEIIVSDDGAGINLDKMKEIYIRNEDVSAENIEKIEKNELLKYIFQSGVSTSEMVTDLSGRGLGMAIALEAVDNLDGLINIETEKDKFTRFHIRLPLSIITYRGILVKIADRKFIVPTHKIKQVLRIDRNNIKTVNNKTTVTVNGEVILLIKLNEILEIDETKSESTSVQVFICELKNRKIAFTIQEVIQEQEVLVKKFNKQLKRVRNIMGATVLGSGEVVPVLNLSDVFESVIKSKNKGSSFNDIDINTEGSKKSVLVVEDSITSRTLLKHILESAKYNVTTAIDGVDGFTKLKEGEYDVVVTDIEMPGMNGFELTVKIREDKKFGQIPIVLISSLSKREDKERGIDAGANAYIIKSNFDQSNLLEVLNRLI